MSENIEASVDSKGCITIPAEVQDRLRLSPGMTLVVEELETGEICLRVREELPELVDKQGILAVTSEATGDLAAAVELERARRVSDLVQRADL